MIDGPWSSTEQRLGRDNADIGSGRVDKTERFLSHSLFASCGPASSSGLGITIYVFDWQKNDLPVQAYRIGSSHGEVVFAVQLGLHQHFWLQSQSQSHRELQCRYETDVFR